MGNVVQARDGRLRIRLSADYQRLEFLRVLRSQPAARIEEAGTLLAPTTAPVLPVEDDITAEADGGADG